MQFILIKITRSAIIILTLIISAIPANVEWSRYLNGRAIYSISEADSFVWVSLNSGVAKISKLSGMVEILDSSNSIYLKYHTYCKDCLCCVFLNRKTVFTV